MPKNNLQVTSHQSLVTNHQKRNRFRDSLFLFLESAVKFHFPFAAGGAVSAPAATSTAADGSAVDVTASKNEEDGDHRHHSIDRGIHGYLLFMSLLIFQNNESDEFCYLAADPMEGAFAEILHLCAGWRTCQPSLTPAYKRLQPLVSPSESDGR